MQEMQYYFWHMQYRSSYYCSEKRRNKKKGKTGGWSKNLGQFIKTTRPPIVLAYEIFLPSKSMSNKSRKRGKPV
jgi:hypothetical protein